MYQKGCASTTILVVDTDDDDAGTITSTQDSKSNSSFSSLKTSSQHTHTTTSGTTDGKSHYKGEWQVPGYTTTGPTVVGRSKKQQSLQPHHRKPEEVWIFRDDDPRGIDERVLVNKPLRGRWGYGPNVSLKSHMLAKSITVGVTSPADMWFFPPNVTTSDFPTGFQQLGDWIKPIYQKDLSILSPGQSGFFTVGMSDGTSGSTPVNDRSPGISGKWKMYGHNDQSTTSSSKLVVKKKNKATKVATGTTTSSDALPPKSPPPPTKKKSTTLTDNAAAVSGTGTTKHKIKVGAAAGAAQGGKSAPTSPTSTFHVHIRKPATSGGNTNVSSSPTTFPVQVQPSYKLIQLKQKINRSRGIPLEVIHLSFNGKEIGMTATDDKVTLQSLGIRNDDVIDLGGIQLYIRTTKGKKFLLTNIDPEISVQSLKGLVTMKEGTPVPDQQLVYMNQLLEDEDPISKYKIKNKASIDLQPSGTLSGPPSRAKNVVVVKKGPAIASTAVTVPDSTAAGGKSTVSSPTALPATPKKKVTATTKKKPPVSSTTKTPATLLSPAGKQKKPAASDKPTSKVVPSSSSSSPTVPSSLTTPVLAPKKSAMKKSSSLTSPHNVGESVPSSSLVSPGGVSSKTKGMVQLLQCDKSIVNLPIDTSDTLTDVHRKAAKKVGLPAKLVCLLDAEGQEVLNDESYTFADGATLRFAPIVAITNSQSNEAIKMCVTPDIATIHDLKLVLEDRMGTPVKEQGLYYDEEEQGILLDDDTPIEKDMNLILDVSAAADEDEVIQFTVKTPNGGKTFVLDIRQEDDEITVLQKIADKAGVPFQVLRLIREDDGEEVDKDNYMIKHGDVLVVGKPKVTIQTADGKVIDLELELSEASSSKILRRKIAKATGIPVSELRLSDSHGEVSNDYLPSNGQRLVIAPPRITIQTPDGETFRLDVENGEVAEDLKAKIAKECGLPVGDLRLSVNDSPLGDDYVPSYGDVVTVAPPRITVITPDRRILHIDVYPDDSSRDVRRKIAKEARIPLDKLYLSVDGEEVDEDYLPPNGTALTIEPPPSIITVELPDGDKLEFEAAPTTTIGEIKEILNDETGTPESDQQLFIVDGDGKSLLDTMVVDKDTNLLLKVAVAKKEEPATISVTVTTREGQVYKLDVERLETAGNVFKRKVAKTVGIPVKNFRLSMDDIELDKNVVVKNGDEFNLTPISKVAVKTSNGKIFNLDINPGDTALDVRERISKEAGIPEKGLLLSVNGEELSRDSIPFHGDLLIIEPPSMTVVTLDGKPVKIDIEVSETHKFMRRKIARILGIPVNELRLSKEEKELEIDYFPCHGDVLSVMGATTVSVQLPDSSTSELPYSKNLTIGGLKKMIEEESGIKKADQCVLTSQGDKQLDDSDLVDCKRAYRMEIIPEPFTITICTPDEQILSLDVSSCTSARDVRELVASQIGLPVKELRLSKAEEELDEDYMPSNGDSLTVQPPTVTVRLPDGTKLELSAPPSTTIVDIKEALEDELGISTAEQSLVEEETGEVMEDDSPVERSLNLVLEVSQKPFTITVNTPDDQVFALEVSPADSAMTVKSKIAKLVGIPVEEVRLSKHDKELEEDYLPVSGDEINLEPPTITVQIPNGSVLELSALPTTTFRDLKETLEEEIEINANDQRLYFLKDDTELDDDAVVKHLMELRLELRKDNGVKSKENGVGNTKMLTIRPRDGENFSINVGADANLEEVKNEISARVDIPVQELRLSFDENEDDGELDDSFVPSDGDILAVGGPTVTVLFPSGDEVELEVTTTTSIGDVKETLEDETGIPASRQCLFLVDSDGNQLVDNMLIKRDLHVKLEEVAEVKVRNVDGYEFSLELSPGATYETVRNEVASRTSVPSSEVRLSLNGANLDKNYVPSKGDVLTVEAKSICVELPEGAKLYVPVTSTSTIADLKRSVEDTSGIASGTWKIMLQDEMGLTDETLLSLPKFSGGAVLKVRLENPEVTINTHDGRSFVMKMDPKDTRNDVRYKVAKELGVLTQDLRLSKDGAPLDKKYKPKNEDVLTVEGQRIKVDLPDGSRIEISVMPTQLIEEVKDAIEKVGGISKSDQKLFFANGKAELDDNKAVSKYGLDESLVLEVRLPERPPVVKVCLPDGSTFKLDLDEGTSLGQVKADIEGHLGLPSGDLELNGRSLQGMDDTKTLKELGVKPKNGDELHVSPPSIEVKLPDGNTINVDALPSTTIADLKLLASSKLSNVSVGDLRVLASGGLDPLDDVVCVANADFLDGLRVESVAEREIQISVEHWNGDVFKVEARPSDNIERIKEQIETLTKIPPDQQTLIYENNPVGSKESLFEQGIGEGAKLTLQPHVINIRLPNGVQHSLTVELDYTIEKVKEMLSPVTLLDVDDQNLIKGEEHVGNGSTLIECGVKIGDTLALEPYMISVLCWSGDIVDVEGIRTKDTIDMVKDVLLKKKSVPKEKQRIMRGGGVLDDDKKTLASYGIGHKDTLILDNPDKVEKSSSADKKGTSAFSFLQKATSLLSSTKPSDITEAKTIEESEEKDNVVTITVITPELKSIKLDIEMNVSATDFREKVAEAVGVDPDDLRLSKFGESVDDTYTPTAQGEVLTVELPPTVTVHLLDGSKLELAASVDTKIEDIKDCLEDETGVARANQKLYTMKGADEVEVTDDMVITEDMELRLKVKDQNGSRDVETEGEYEEVVEERVEYEQISVDDDDEAVEEKGKPKGSDKQEFIESPKRNLKDGKMKEFKTKPMEIYVRDPTGTLHTILFQKEATVEDLKYKIPTYSGKSGNTVDECIIMNGRELDPNKTLEECGVTDGEELQLEAYALQIMHFMSVILPLDSVSRLDTVGAVKEKLAAQQSIPKHEQKLSIQGKNVVLDDNFKTLKEYGIKHKTVLVLQEGTGNETEKSGNQSVEDTDEKAKILDEKAKNLDDRIAKIKERAEARKMARMKGGR